ncbi:MAG TPA: UDP-N-acetylmuramoyl-tripeptide--D-alanyl-D-alanine ligase [Acidobacteriaceae bacterium]|nr:UDP-N-acetylmuramoyl-tripeptide--D-alanyl-D-alanine ligase [Acidobacteriaceae bacterium]
MNLTLGQIADWTHAEGDFDPSLTAIGYSIDSRTLNAGELFFAVRGERMDGHDYVEDALTNGAIAAVVSMRWLTPPNVDPAKLLRVPDRDECVLHAMQQLANRVRRVWGGRVIGITGSAGKTTTKECVAAVLTKKFEVLKTTGNLNNHFGVPLQLLRLEPHHEVAVLEMGMNHAGELTALAKIAEPDWAVVSNVAPVHLEFFPEGIAGIARAKYELVAALPPEGYAILNADDERVAAFARGMGERALLYGTDSRSYVRADDIRDDGLDGTRFALAVEELRREVHLRLIGRHNVLNALAAISVGLLSDIDIDTCVAAVEEMRPTEKRGRVLEFHGARLIDDTYNSNPRALASMVEALRQTPASRRFVIAGEMLELGPEGAALHRSAGEQMGGLDAVIGVRGLASEIVKGARASGVTAEFVESPGEASVWLEQNLRKGDVVLLKGSRGVHLERAIEALQE